MLRRNNQEMPKALSSQRTMSCDAGNQSKFVQGGGLARNFWPYSTTIMNIVARPTIVDFDGLFLLWTT